MFYDRKVKYLNYYEAGEALRGSGFLKLEVRDKVLRWEISVKGLRDISGSFPILFVGEKEAVIAELTLVQGSGTFRQECHIESDIASSGITYSDWRGVRIPLDEGREVACYWEPCAASSHTTNRIHAAEQRAETVDEAEPATPVVKREMQAVVEGTEADASAAKRTIQILVEGEEPDASNTRNVVENTQERMERNAPNVRRNRREQISTKSQNLSERSTSETWREDKWSQLCAIYPHINPFRDEREYLSISPADFVLFPEKDYRAVHNSFLLHGYYNYKHLILARMEIRGEFLYYVGVPGNYCEREKQVAVMFRFESFECASEPAEYGDFGYYMMRVNL